MSAISSWREFIFRKSDNLIKSPFNRPNIQNYGSLSSAIKVVQSTNRLSAGSSPHTLEKIVAQNARLKQSKAGQLKAIVSAVNDIRKQLDTLKSEQTYTSTAVEIISGTNFKAVSHNADQGEFTLKVDQIATHHTIGSAQFVDTNIALGIEGTFKLNGIAIQVETTDSLTDISEKINWGEDVDRNGVLGWNEDINANGIIDTYGNPGHLYPDGPFSEDFNGNGVLDSTEDIDGDLILDGGTAEHNITSYIDDHRLILRSATTGSTEIRLFDNTNVLNQLGVVSENMHGEFDIQFTLEAAQDAIFHINDQPFTSETNTITTAVKDLEIRIIEASNSTSRFKIKEDIKVIKSEIEAFVQAYNELITAINIELQTYKNIEGEKELQEMKLAINEKISASVSEINDERFDELSDFGISKLKVPSQHITQPNLDNLITKQTALKNKNTPFSMLIKNLESGLNFANVSSIVSALGDLGILNNLDGTLDVNEKKLESALKHNLAKVKELFKNEKDGIATRLENYFVLAADESFGALPQAQEKINRFLNDFDELEKKTKLLLEQYSTKNAMASQIQANMNVFSQDA